MSLKRQRKNRGRWVGVLGVAAAMVIVLAGCVMPAGTVYTIPPEAAPSETNQVEVAAPKESSPVEEFVQTADEPSPADPFITQGDDYLDKGDYESALDEYAQAIDVDPSEPRGYYGRGQVYANLGDLESAIDDLDQALTKI